MAAEDTLSPGLRLLLTRRIGLMSAAMHLPPGAATAASLRAALSANAEHVRLPRLADDLNPMVLDPARVEAFIEGLPRQRESVLRRLESRWLALGLEGLYLSTASPVTAEAIASGFELIVADDDSLVVNAHLRVPLRQAYAQQVAARAQAAVDEFAAEVAELEATRAVHPVLMQAKWRRYAVAAVWRIAAKALADQDFRYTGELKRAAAAVARYLTPPWVGLPPR